LFEEALEALETSCQDFDSELQAIGTKHKALSDRLSHENAAKATVEQELATVMYDMEQLAKLLQSEEIPEVDSSDEEEPQNESQLDLETRIANIAQGMWEASEERRRMVTNLGELEERFRQHEERFTTRIRHKRAELDRTQVVFLAAQDGLENPADWDTSEERNKLIGDIEKLESQLMMGSTAFKMKVEEERAKMDTAEENFRLRAVDRLQKGEKVNGLDSWYVPASRPTTKGNSRPQTQGTDKRPGTDGRPGTGTTDSVGRVAFPPRQEEMLFTVEEERADQAAQAAEQDMLQKQEAQDKMQYELERLRRLEAKMAGKAGKGEKKKGKAAQMLEEGSNGRSAEEEVSHWRKLALESEQELEMITDKSMTQAEKIEAQDSTISKLKDRQIQMQKRYTKEITEQGTALMEMKSKADSADSKAMIKRMVDMARQLAELTEANRELEDALAKQSNTKEGTIRGLKRELFEVEAACLSRVETVNRQLAENEIIKAKATEDLHQAENRHRELEAMAGEDVDALRDELHAAMQNVHTLIGENEQKQRRATIAQQQASVAAVERDLALRGLATYRERRPHMSDMEIAEADVHAAKAELEAARASGDPALIAKAEESLKLAAARLAELRAKHVSTLDVESAWAELLKSLPKRTKIKVLTKNAFRKVVNELHQEKIQTAGMEKLSEPAFIQDFFQKRYGLDEIADTYLFGFLCSLQKYTPKEMGFENPGVVYYLNRLRSEIDHALESRKCVIMPVND